jgi:hypothetical protein
MRTFQRREINCPHDRSVSTGELMKSKRLPSNIIGDQENAVMSVILVAPIKKRPLGDQDTHAFSLLCRFAGQLQRLLSSTGPPLWAQTNQQSQTIFLKEIIGL